MKKMLVIVPHQDDELSIAGQLFCSNIKNTHYEIFVLYTTNGDCYESDTYIRLEEAEKALSHFGIDSKHIIFLGYPDMDSINTGINIYDLSSRRIVVYNGRKETYGLPQNPDYRYKKDGRHSSYCRNDLLIDMIDVIKDIRPECIIVNGMDWHPDHRMTYLLTREAVGNILKSDSKYHPIFLMKYAYGNNWLGRDDYHIKPLLPAKDIEKNDPDPQGLWNERIRFESPNECRTFFLSNNIVYKALKEFRSQNAWIYAGRFLNSDVFYWKIETNNQALYANTYASSGDKSFINDFKVVDSSCVAGAQLKYDKGIWIPDEHDEKKEVVLTWEAEIEANIIKIYENCSPFDNITLIGIKINEKPELYEKISNHNGGAIVVNNPFEGSVFRIAIRIIEADSSSAGITEIEILDKTKIENDILPLSLYDAFVSRGRKNYVISMIAAIEHIILLIKKIICCKLFPNHYFMRRKYNILIKRKYLLPIMWIYRLCFWPIDYFIKLLKRQGRTKK